MNVAELFARIGVKADTAKVEEFSKSMRGAKSVAIGVAATVAAVAAGIVKIVDSATNAAVSLKQFAAESGASTQQLQQWQSVAQQTNTSMDAITESVKALADNRQKIKLGQGNISAYQLLGINPDQDPFQVLEQLKAKTEGLAPAMKKTVLQQMGVSAQLIQVLNLTNAQFDRMKANAFIIPDSAIQSVAAAKASMDNLGSAVKWFNALLAEKLAPWIEKVTRKIIEWIKQNKDGLIQGIQRLFNILTRVFEVLMNVVSMTSNMIQNTIGWKNAIIGLIGILAIMNASLLASPLTWFIAGILALILLMDDFYHYQKGDRKHTLFGDFFKAFPQMKGIVLGVFDTIKKLWTGLGAFLDADTPKLAAITKQWGEFGKGVFGVYTLLRMISAIMTAVMTGDWKNLGSWLSRDLGDYNKETADKEHPVYNTWDEFANALGKNFSDMGNDFMKLFNPTGGTNILGSTLHPSTATSSQTIINNNQTNTFNINGAEHNPADVARSIHSELKSQLNATEAQRVGRVK